MATKVVPIRLTQEATDALAKRAAQTMETPTGLAARLVLEGLERLDKADARAEGLLTGPYVGHPCTRCDGEKEGTRPRSENCRTCSELTRALSAPAATSLREEAEGLGISRRMLTGRIVTKHYERRDKKQAKKEK